MGFFSFLTGGVSFKEAAHLKQFEQKLQYKFRDRTLLKKALTHKSYTNENKLSSLFHNERLEFLGDAVLELAISDMMMAFFPEATEGDMSKLRAAVVNETRLAELARNISLGDFLYLGRGEDQCQGREKDSLLSDAYEAVLGAIYLDAGFKPAYKAIKVQFHHLLVTATFKDISQDFKTRLQEVSQNKFQAIPQYRLVDENGPDHDKTFEIHLFINQQLYGTGFGKSKKQAEQSAAKSALDKILNA